MCEVSSGSEKVANERRVLLKKIILKKFLYISIVKIMIVMKFGGSSVADAERIKHVAEIIKTYREKRPVVVLSAMGDTTDYLLESAEVALTGKVDIENVVTLHKKTIDELSLSFSKIEDLLLELNHLLTGISMIKELTKKTRDYLVSFGERLSVRIMSEYLNSIGGSTFSNIICNNP